MGRLVLYSVGFIVRLRHREERFRDGKIDFTALRQICRSVQSYHIYCICIVYCVSVCLCLPLFCSSSHHHLQVELIHAHQLRPHRKTPPSLSSLSPDSSLFSLALALSLFLTPSSHLLPLYCIP